MALLKNRTDDRGITTTYHKVDNVSLNDGRLHFLVRSYVSKEYRQNASEVDTLNYFFNITTEEEESMGIRQLCYSKLKTLEAWSDAEDC